MGTDDGAGSGMQFDKVETAGPVAAPACARCARPLDEYFELGGHMFCRPCIDGFRGGAGSFWRALLFGVGAAALGSLVWFAVYKLSNGSSFGIIGIAVGLFVGFAVRKGSRGLGGWRYQALAMVLTYLAITTSYVPLILEASVEGPAHADDEQDPTADPTVAPPASGTHAKAPPPFGMLVLVMFALATTVPFTGGVGFMGWIIIGIALYEAWKLNRRVPISGPFRFSGGLSVPVFASVTPGMPLSAVVS